jgi:chitinase
VSQPTRTRLGVESLDGRCLPSANPALSISDVSLAEGNSGQTAFVFTVSLSEASSKQVRVKYATANGTARTGDGDFIGKSGTLTFAPGETTKTVTILVNGDAAVEADEQFFVNLSRARNATIADAQGIGTINNDDSLPPGMAIDPYSGLPYVSMYTDF